MDGPHTPLSVYLRVIFFGTPYTCVLFNVWYHYHFIRQCNRIFFYGEINTNSAFFAFKKKINFSCDIEFKFTLPNIQI